MKNILVTGGAGYIGSHLCKLLAKEGYIPLTVDNLSNGHVEAVKWGPLFIADVADERTLGLIIRQTAPTAIIHLAGRIEARSSLHEEELFMRDNYLTTRSVVRVMKRYGVPHLIYASTAAVYKESFHPLTESSPIRPLNSYGRSKLAAESLIQNEVKSFAILRLFNACGADLSGEIGENHPIETHLIPLALFAAARLRPIFKLYGMSHPTGDGTAVRDFIHVNDIARGLLLSLKTLLQEGAPFIANLGSGTPSSVASVLRAVEKAVAPVPVALFPHRADEPSILVSDTNFIHKRLGFTPKYSDMPLIIETAYKWMRQCHM